MRSENDNLVRYFIIKTSSYFIDFSVVMYPFEVKGPSFKSFVKWPFDVLCHCATQFGPKGDLD